ncbi:MAG TPA: DMT family transporter [Acidimicrobiales bacterium]|nr:DMT family transporter [Acidimicrobiales bacterium]
MNPSRPRALRHRKGLVAAIMLVLASAGWGSTFVVMKAAVAHAPVPEFLAWRFLLASLLLVAVRPRALLRLGWRGWGQGLALGLILAAGYLVQTYGLESTSAALSGFLTGLQVVFTPLLAWALLHQRPGRRIWAASLVATLGLAVIALHGLSFGIGEVLTVASALLFAAQIVGVGHWARAADSYGTATVQLLVVGLVCLVTQAPSGFGLPPTAGEWGAVIVTAVAATAFAFVVQSWAQLHLPVATTSVIVTLEPVFSAVFAWGVGEPIGWSVLLGGGMVVASMLILGLDSRPERAAGTATPETDPPAVTGMAEVVALAGAGGVPAPVAAEVDGSPESRWWAACAGS